AHPLRAAGGAGRDVAAVDEGGDPHRCGQRTASPHQVGERERVRAVVDDRAAADDEVQVLRPERPIDGGVAADVGVDPRLAAHQYEADEVEVSLDVEVALDDQDPGAGGVAVQDYAGRVAQVRDLGVGGRAVGLGAVDVLGAVIGRIGRVAPAGEDVGDDLVQLGAARRRRRRHDARDDGRNHRVN